MDDPAADPAAAADPAPSAPTADGATGGSVALDGAEQGRGLSPLAFSGLMVGYVAVALGLLALSGALGLALLTVLVAVAVVGVYLLS